MDLGGVLLDAARLGEQVATEVHFPVLLGLLEGPCCCGRGRLGVGEEVGLDGRPVYSSAAIALAGPDLEEAPPAAEDVSPQLLDAVDFLLSLLCYHYSVTPCRGEYRSGRAVM